MNLLTKQKETNFKTNLWLPKGKGERGERNQEVGINTHIVLYIKQVISKDLLYSIGSSTQCSVITYMEKNLKKNGYI